MPVTGNRGNHLLNKSDNNLNTTKIKVITYEPHAVVVHRKIASPLACEDCFEDHLVVHQLLKQFL